MLKVSGCMQKSAEVMGAMNKYDDIEPRALTHIRVLFWFVLCVLLDSLIWLRCQKLCATWRVRWKRCVDFQPSLHEIV